MRKHFFWRLVTFPCLVCASLALVTSCSSPSSNVRVAVSRATLAPGGGIMDLEVSVDLTVLNQGSVQLTFDRAVGEFVVGGVRRCVTQASLSSKQVVGPGQSSALQLQSLNCDFARSPMFPESTSVNVTLQKGDVAVAGPVSVPIPSEMLIPRKSAAGESLSTAPSTNGHTPIETSPSADSPLPGRGDVVEFAASVGGDLAAGKYVIRSIGRPKSSCRDTQNRISCRAGSAQQCMPTAWPYQTKY